jgi:hypothetical protein
VHDAFGTVLDFRLQTDRVKGRETGLRRGCDSWFQAGVRAYWNGCCVSRSSNTMKRKVPLCRPARSDHRESRLPGAEAFACSPRETRLVDLMNRRENLSLCVRRRVRRNLLRGDRLDRRPRGRGAGSLLLRRCLLRCGLRILLGCCGFLHGHRCLLVVRHTCLNPTGMNRPVPAPIHTKSFNIWKRNFARNGLFFCE